MSVKRHLEIYERPYMNQKVEMFFDPPVIPNLLKVNKNMEKNTWTLAYISSSKVISYELGAVGDLTQNKEISLGNTPIKDIKGIVVQSQLVSGELNSFFAFNEVSPKLKTKRNGAKLTTRCMLTKLMV